MSIRTICSIGTTQNVLIIIMLYRFQLCIYSASEIIKQVPSESSERNSHIFEYSSCPEVLKRIRRSDK